jgi:hypothetical protein
VCRLSRDRRAECVATTLSSPPRHRCSVRRDCTAPCTSRRCVRVVPVSTRTGKPFDSRTQSNDTLSMFCRSRTSVRSAWPLVETTVTQVVKSISVIVLTLNVRIKWVKWNSASSDSEIDTLATPFSDCHHRCLRSCTVRTVRALEHAHLEILRYDILDPMRMIVHAGNVRLSTVAYKTLFTIL